MATTTTEKSQEKRLLITEECPGGLSFVKDKQEHSILQDGRRKMEWWLEDINGKYHLAITGIEGQSRDGHYTYTAQSPFSDVLPLVCKNRTGVFNWLGEWIEKDSIEIKPRLTPNWPRRPRRPRNLDLEMDGEGLSDTSEKQKHKRTPQEKQTASQRRKPRITFKVGNPNARAAKIKAAQKEDEALQNPHEMSVITALDNIQYEAEKEAADKKNEVKLVINVMNTETSLGDVSQLQRWQNILEELYYNWTVENRIFTANDTKGKSNDKIINKNTGFSYLQSEFYGQCIEAIREISGMFIPIKLLAQSEIITFFKKFENYPDANISKSTKDALAQWKEMTTKIAECVSNKDFLKDPRLKTEDLIINSQFKQLHSNHRTNKRRIEKYYGPLDDEEIVNDFNDTKYQKLSDDSEDKESKSEESIEMDNAMIGRKYPREFYLKRIQQSMPVYKYSDYAGSEPVAIKDPSKFNFEDIEDPKIKTNGNVIENVNEETLLEESRKQEFESDVTSSIVISSVADASVKKTIKPDDLNISDVKNGNNLEKITKQESIEEKTKIISSDSTDEVTSLSNTTASGSGSEKINKRNKEKKLGRKSRKSKVTKEKKRKKSSSSSSSSHGGSSHSESDKNTQHSCMKTRSGHITKSKKK